MGIFLRGTLLVVSFFTFSYVVHKIRKAQFQIGDSVFWVFFFLLVFILGAFPAVGVFFADLLGFYSPVNFILVSVIFIMLIKIFFQSFQISQMESKIKALSQRIALEGMSHGHRKDK